MKADLRQEAIEKLKYYNLKKQSLKVTMTEYRRLGEEMARIHAADGHDRVSGGIGSREDRLVSLIQKRDTLRCAMRNTRAWIRVVDKALAAICEEDRMILDMLYINRAQGNVDRLCELLFVEKATVYRRRDRALHAFTIAMFGDET